VNPVRPLMIDLGGPRIAVDRLGPEGREPILFLHGLGAASTHDLRPTAMHPLLAGRERVLLDLPGFGRSTAPAAWPATLEAHATIVIAVLDRLGLETVDLVGHSMGGMVAQEAYARNPANIAGLVLGFTSPAFPKGGSDFARKFIEDRIGPLDAGQSMADVAARLMPAMRGHRSDPAGLAHAQKIMSEIPPDTYRRAVRLLTTFDRRADLARIAVPTLLVAGSDDRTAPASVLERMGKEIPGADFVTLEGCGHLGPMDQPDEFNEALAGFLKRHSL